MAAFPQVSSAAELVHWLRTEGPSTPGVALANAVAQRLQAMDGSAPSPRLSIFLLRTATIEPLGPFLQYHLCRAGVSPTLQFSGYSDWRALASSDESDLYRSNPNIVVVFLRLEEVSPRLLNHFGGLSASEIQEEKERTLREFDEIISAVRARSKAKVLVNNFPPVPQPSLGLADVAAVPGQNTTIDQLDYGLQALCSRHSDVHVFDYRLWSARVGLDSIADRRMWLTARVPLSGKVLNSLAVEYVRYLNPLLRPRRKCLVLDLDNTLWGGILGEDGAAGLKLGHDFPGNAFREFQQAVLDLYHRGTILAVCSKNNESDARTVLQEHPDMILRLHHFAKLQINWDDKVTNLRRIAAELNLGLDSLAFADDNPAERAMVRQLLPEVLVIDLPAEPAEYASALRNVVEFETLSLSPEDRQRGAIYRAQAERKQLKDQSGSLEQYYASLEMSLELGKAESFTIPRIAQLTQKTNQFNLTTRRYSEADITRMAVSPTWQVYWLRLQDRFGDNGIVGAALLQQQKGGSWALDTFLLSCRVLGRTVETAFLAAIVRELEALGVQRLEGWYLATERNTPSKDFYPRHGFEKVDVNHGGATLWRLALPNHRLKLPPWFRVEQRTSKHGKSES